MGQRAGVGHRQACRRLVGEYSREMADLDLRPSVHLTDGRLPVISPIACECWTCARQAQFDAIRQETELNSIDGEAKDLPVTVREGAGQVTNGGISSIFV